MGDNSGGGKTTIASAQAPPQLLPQAAQGYQAAQDYYQGILGNPPIYGGPRVADQSPYTVAGITQTGETLGAPTTVETTTAQQLADTESGNYLSGPQAQAAVGGLSQPIFQNFAEQVLPGIRDQAQFTGQGVDSTRRDLATSNAVNQLGQGLGAGAIAPIYTSERSNMTNAAKIAPSTIAAENLRLGALENAGQLEQGQAQAEINAQQQAFEEPIFRQGAAAGSLLGAGQASPGNNVTTQQQTLSGKQQTSSTIGEIASIATIAAVLAA